MWKGGSPRTLVSSRQMKGRSYIERHSRFQKTSGFREPSSWRATTHTISSSHPSLSTSLLPFLKMFNNSTSLATLGSITTTFTMVPLGSSLPTRCVLYKPTHIQMCTHSCPCARSSNTHTHTHIYPCIHTCIHTHTRLKYILDAYVWKRPICPFHLNNSTELSKRLNRYRISSIFWKDIISLNNGAYPHSNSP